MQLVARDGLAADVLLQPLQALIQHAVRELAGAGGARSSVQLQRR